MTNEDIARKRLCNQHIAPQFFNNPAELVGCLGAVQAQDYTAAKWALGLRMEGAVDCDIEHAFNSGSILRTHVLRPTWHFVTPADIRWMLALSAPRINAFNAYYHRSLGLDHSIFTRSNAALSKALEGGRHLTRTELTAVLQAAGIATDGLRLIHLVCAAELDGVICSGARRGNQFTYALLDERVPPRRTLDREEALSMLALRYFRSHGPAALADFAWWSGLGMADARKGLQLVKSEFTSEQVDGREYWFSNSQSHHGTDGTSAFLFPNYDEFMVGYKDRGAVYDPSHGKELGPRTNILFYHAIVIGGRIAGTWRRAQKTNLVEIELNPLIPFKDYETHAVELAAVRYGQFLGQPVSLIWSFEGRR
jgi:hypothetical protein